MGIKGNIQCAFGCLIFGVFIILRYLSLEIDPVQVFTFMGYYCLACTALIFSLFKYRDPINPISIYTIFIYLMSYSFMRLSSQQGPYSLSTLLVLNLSVFFYLIFASFSFRFKPFKLFKLNNELKRYFIYLICGASFITFLIEVAMFGYLPVLNIGSSDVYIETNAKLVPFLHYFIVLLAFVPSWAYLLYKEQIITKKELILLGTLTIFILVNYLSRQLYLLLGITLYMSYSFYNTINTKVLIRSLFLVLGLFMFVGYLKFNSEISISFAEFSRIAAGIDNDRVSILEATFTEYSSKRFTSLNDMVVFKDQIGFYGFGMYTFRPLLSFFLLEKIGLISRLPKLDSEMNVGTYAADPYLDYGLIGVILLNAFYGFLASRYYKQYKENRPEAIIKFSIIMFCIIMGMFINYFNTMLIWLGFIFNKILIGGLQSLKNEEL
jgi:oligosaccharide repeat unit polymerase